MVIDKIRTTEALQQNAPWYVKNSTARVKRDWKRYLQSLAFSYKATHRESTGHSPFELMFDWKPKLPVDTFIQVCQGSSKLLKKTLQKAEDKQKTTYEIQPKASHISIGN